VAHPVKKSAILKAGNSVEVDYLPAWNYAVASAGLNPVVGLSCRSDPTGMNVTGFRIRGIGYQADLVTMAPTKLEPAFPPYQVELELEGVGTRLAAHLELIGHDAVLGSFPISILPTWKWPHLRETRIVTAGYVLPEHDRVRRLVGEVDGRAARANEEPPGGKSGVRTVVQTLYDLLVLRKVRYEFPYLETDTWSGCTYQTVRQPHEILVDDGLVSGSGTCLDLTLLFAGCLESLGLSPVLLFTGDLESAPRHVFPGCWLGSGSRIRPVLTQVDDLRRSVERGELMVWEATGICSGAERLEFAASETVAQNRLKEMDVFHAVDVSACRPPRGAVRPVQLPYDPPVREALESGARLARALGAKNHETLHVLYGLCTGAGELTAGILKACGGSASQVIERLNAALPPEGNSAEPLPTRNHEVCLALARSNARRRGSSSVAEGDLLWALLEGPGRNVRRVLQAAGCPPEALAALLALRWPRPGDGSVSRQINQDNLQ
jgi:hypothetical protein